MVNKDWDICGCGVSAFDGKEGVALVCQVEEGKNPCNHVMHFGCTAHKVEAFMQGEPLTCPACQQSVLLYHRLDGSGSFKVQLLVSEDGELEGVNLVAADSKNPYSPQTN